MAKIDLMAIQPTRLCKDLSSRFALLYGPEKAGKTSTSVMWPKPLLCAFEIGYHALVGVYPADIDCWTTFKDVCRQLKKPEMKERFSTIIIDTVAIAYNMCEKYILSRENVSSIGEIGYGRGWSMLKDEFENTFRELTRLGYAIVFLAHSKNIATQYTDEAGNAIEGVTVDLPNACRQIVNRLVDVIAYLSIERNPDGSSSRYLLTRATPTIFAGSRYRTLQEKIPLGYQELVDAVAKAMEDEAKITGTNFVSEEEINNNGVIQERRSFQETMTEAKELWSSFLEVADTDERENHINIMRNVIGKIFGNSEFKLSQAIPSQQDMVELFIDEMRDLM